MVIIKISGTDHRLHVTRMIPQLKIGKRHFELGIKIGKTPKVQQQGMTEMNIVDKDNNFIAGVEIKKGFSSNEYVDYYFYW